MASHGHKVAVVQPDKFEFTAENFKRAEEVIARYPAGRQRSAVMPLLEIAQEQHDGWLPRAAMDYVAAVLGLAPMKVYEVASFYTMYNLQPVGKHHLQVCTTTPCWLRGSDDIMKTCETKLGVKSGETTADGLFTLQEVECLGACVNAPMMQVTSATPYRDGFYEDLTPHLVDGLIDALAANQTPEFGSLSGRKSSEPATGATTLQKGKKAKPKMDAQITTLDDTGEPSEEGLAILKQQEEKEKALQKNNHSDIKK
jgi:NADH-quinone oxidoreductase E subunit